VRVHACSCVCVRVRVRVRVCMCMRACVPQRACARVYLCVCACSPEGEWRVRACARSPEGGSRMHVCVRAYACVLQREDGRVRARAYACARVQRGAWPSHAFVHARHGWARRVGSRVRMVGLRSSVPASPNQYSDAEFRCDSVCDDVPV
jgi:hypothetical protein